MNKLTDFLIFLGLYNIVTVVHLLGHILVGRLMGLKITMVTFGWVPCFKIQTPLFLLEIGILPLGGSVKFTDAFETSPIPVKWLATLGGPLLGILSALIGLPFDRILPSLLSGFGQIINSVFSPVDYGSPLFHRFFDEYLRTSLFAAYGILAIKVEAMNLLPLPLLNGGQLLTAFFPHFSDSRWGMRIATTCLLIVMAMNICWAVALAVYLFK